MQAKRSAEKTGRKWEDSGVEAVCGPFESRLRMEPELINCMKEVCEEVGTRSACVEARFKGTENVFADAAR
jgi:hypothetical protein